VVVNNQPQNGQVIGIFIAASGGEQLRSVSTVNAVAGRGLDGDRYFLHTGSFAKKGKPLSPGMEVTLIESEAIEALEREYAVQLEAQETRRNLITRGIALNHLVGRSFRVGPAELRGVKLCEPCGHLEKLTRDGVRKGLIHRGGLRCQIVSGGTISVGDPISVQPIAERGSCG
jgi:MOSC domain-containing protein YiiM